MVVLFSMITWTVTHRQCRSSRHYHRECVVRHQDTNTLRMGCQGWGFDHWGTTRYLNRFSFSMAWNVCWTVELLICQNWLSAESVLYFSFWSNDPGMKWIKFCEERNLWKVWAIPGELGFYFPPQSLATWGLTTRTNTKIPNSQPIDFEALSIV